MLYVPLKPERVVTLLVDFPGPGRGVGLLLINGELYRPLPGSGTVVLKGSHQENLWEHDRRVILHE